MPIKKSTCRITERRMMKQKNAAGYSVGQISVEMSIREAVIERVLSGEWDAAEERNRVVSKKLQQERKDSAIKSKEDEAIKLGTAIAQAMKSAESPAPKKRRTRKAAPKEVEIIESTTD